MMKSTVQPAAEAPLNSAVYEGVVRHRRYAPTPHSFSYRVGQLLVDLDELDRIFAGRWLWSSDRPNLAEFRRGDFLGPDNLPLADAVRMTVQKATGYRPPGPIRLLTHLRYAGYSFNPVSFYYCYEADSVTLACILAEITNTPWRERHAYVLPVSVAEQHGRSWRWSFSKAFHVSPFLPMDRQYQWSLSAPGRRLHVHMNVMNQLTPDFEATLVLERRALDAGSLRRLLWRYPLMTAQVIGAIHWQALRLWFKGNPTYDHPTATGVEP